MTGLLRRLLGARDSGAARHDEQKLAAERQLQALRLELAERDKKIAQLSADLQRLKAHSQNEVQESTREQLATLMRAAAAPVVQLLAQKHLLEIERKPVEARHVMGVAARLVRVLEDEGLTIESKPGDRVRFDPSVHEPLSSEAKLTPGQAAVVRLPTVSFQGQLIRKAGVVAQS